MAMRGSPEYRVAGNPLAGVLRDLSRTSRSTTRGGTRRSAPRPAEEAPTETVTGPRGPEGPRGPAGPPGAAWTATVAVTGDDGRARWDYRPPFAGAPVLTAAAVDPAPGDDETTVTVALEEVTAVYAVVRVWRTRPRRGSGVVEPAGAGVSVHLAAMPAPAGPPGGLG